jgi:O-antigen biosynthesis protein
VLADPTVAIGIVAYEDPSAIERTLESLRKYPQQSHEIWILGDGPDAETANFIESCSGIQKSCTVEPRGMAACLNRFASLSPAKILVLVEQGSVFSSSALEKLLNALSEKNIGLAGPSTNLCWNKQQVFQGQGDSEQRSLQLAKKFGKTSRQLSPLYSLADFCYAIRREVFEAIGPADEGYGLGPCWEMDYNIRAERRGWHGVWVGAAYVERSKLSCRRQKEEERRFESSRQRYQNKFCGLRLCGQKTDYRSHCRGDECANFAPPALIAPQTLTLGPGAAASVQPLVSCIMLTCDRRHFVPRAIACFLSQDYPQLELIMVDSGNDPISDLVPNDPRIRYFSRAHNLTLGALRNHACELARGEIIMHCDDDDWYSVNRVSLQVAAMSERRAEVSGTSRLHYYQTARNRAFLYQYAGGPRPWVAGNTLAYRRSFWQNHRFPEVQVGEDSRFVWSAASASVLDLKQSSLCVATIHESNVSPKNPHGAFWKEEPVNVVLDLMNQAKASHESAIVSCIMPTFNRRPFIPLALECFSSQTYRHKELIVVDDGTDPVEDLIKAMPSVRYVRVQQRLTIGAKRNLACSQAEGEIIAHWDDDDWYAPERLEKQVNPILQGSADITGLINRFVLQMPHGEFWTVGDALHRRMFEGDVHGGTLVFRKSILEKIKYPESNLAEDAVLVREARRMNRRLERLENQGLFVYIRHACNAWKFNVGKFLDPKGWIRTIPPSGFSIHTLDLYRSAAMAMQ